MRLVDLVVALVIAALLLSALVPLAQNLLETRSEVTQNWHLLYQLREQGKRPRNGQNTTNGGWHERNK